MAGKNARRVAADRGRGRATPLNAEELVLQARAFMRGAALAPDLPPAAQATALLLPLLPNGWTPETERLLSLLTAPQLWPHAAHEVYRWARELACEEPRSELWAQLAQALEAKGLAPSELIAQALEGGMAPLRTASGRSTSTARWVVSLFESEPRHVLAAVAFKPGQQLALGLLLLLERPELFERHLEDLATNNQSVRAWLIASMLQESARRFGDAAVRLAGELTEARPAFLAAQTFAACRRGTDAIDCAERALRALRQDDDLVTENLGRPGATVSLRLTIVDWLLENFGPYAEKALWAYTEPKALYELAFYEKIAAGLGEKSVPLIAEGLERARAARGTPLAEPRRIERLLALLDRFQHSGSGSDSGASSRRSPRPTRRPKRGR